jgi:hypothetical protein
MFLLDILIQVSYQLIINSFLLAIPLLIIFYLTNNHQVLSLAFWSLIAINPFLTTMTILNEHDINVHILVQCVLIGMLALFGILCFAYVKIITLFWNIYVKLIALFWNMIFKMFTAFITVTFISCILTIIPLFGYFDLFNIGCEELISYKCLRSGFINISFLILLIFACLSLLGITLRVYDNHRFRSRKYRFKSYLLISVWLIIFALVIPYLTTNIFIENFLMNSLTQLCVILFVCYLMCLNKLVKFW